MGEFLMGVLAILVAEAIIALVQKLLTRRNNLPHTSARGKKSAEH